MSIKTRILAGELCEVWVCNNLMRFSVCGSYYHLPDEAEQKAKKCNMLIERYKDGSASVETQFLIKWDADDNTLNEMCDDVLNYIEYMLGIQNCAISSSAWNAGHTDDRLDSIMTKIEQKIIAKENN